MRYLSYYVVASLLVSLSMAFTGSARAQSGSPVAPKPVARAHAMPNAAPPTRGPNDGIAVHGHWTIEVRNPDGTLAKHIEFENGLCPTTTLTGLYPGYILGGGILLTNILLGAPTNGWNIQLASQPTPPTANSPLPCYGPNVVIPYVVFLLEQSNDTNAHSQSCVESGVCFPTLTPPTATGLTAAITLAGTFTVPASVSTVTITAVGTGINYCGAIGNGVSANAIAAQSSDECLTSGGFRYQLTGANLTGVAPMPGPLTLVASQSVSVTVQISFS